MICKTESFTGPLHFIFFPPHQCQILLREAGFWMRKDQRTISLNSLVDWRGCSAGEEGDNGGGKSFPSWGKGLGRMMRMFLTRGRLQLCWVWLGGMLVHSPATCGLVAQKAQVGRGWYMSTRPTVQSILLRKGRYALWGLPWPSLFSVLQGPRMLRGSV